MRRYFAVAVIAVSLAAPAAFAAPRGDDPGGFRERIAKIVRHIVHVLDDFTPVLPRP